MDGSACASKNLYSKLPPSDNTSKHQDWMDACREATEAINEAKTDSWNDLLQDAMSNSDDPNMWKVIQGLSGAPDAPNEANLATVEPSLTSNPKPTFLFTTMPGSVNLPCCKSMKISNINSRNVSTHHLLTMKSVLHFKWVSYYLP